MEAISFAEVNADKADTETKYLMMFRAYLAKGEGKEAAHQLNALYEFYPEDIEVTIKDIWFVFNTVYSYELRGIITNDTVSAFNGNEHICDDAA